MNQIFTCVIKISKIRAYLADRALWLCFSDLMQLIQTKIENSSRSWGNAILKPDQKGTIANQLSNVRATASELAELVQYGHHISITHGNGPQVGELLLLYELGKKTVPKMPLDVLGAEKPGHDGVHAAAVSG